MGATTLASQLSAIPLSETRLRDEGLAPLYSFVRKLTDTLKSSAQQRGVTVPAIPAIPADWSGEAPSDPRALAAQFRPHLAEQARVVIDWNIDLRDRVPKPHWSSVVATYVVSFDLFIRMAPGKVGPGGAMGGSEWGPFMAQMASDEIKGIVGVINEEILRIRAQPGSGWNEEEAKALTMEHLGKVRGLMDL